MRGSGKVYFGCDALSSEVGTLAGAAFKQQLYKSHREPRSRQHVMFNTSTLRTSPMAFISDNVNFRTYDPETGWELEVENGGGKKYFKLVHPNKPSIEFKGEMEFVRRLPELDVPGKGPAYETIYHLERLDWNDPREATPEQLEMVRDALVAYGVVHNGPLPGTFKVVPSEQ
jgi:hypothetical protein